ncbi:hypothetical protein NQZ79_g5389 [Umbelopsis isabellina]|nr:hypothetical protein NQZ79_g5389 [Umbelopsis isabellina]
MNQRPLQFALDPGTSQYVTYYEGTLPLILAAPHGGRLFPSNIPDRKLENGTITVTDAYTKDVALGIARKLYEKTGDIPHIVILQLARTKVDVNRDKLEGADSTAGREEYHDTIKRAIAKINANHDHGMFVDIHGHGHPENWIELGYLLDNFTLKFSDEDLNERNIVSSSSIRSLSQRYPDIAFSSFLRGNSSIGNRLSVKHRLKTTPSRLLPYPHRNQKYFFGGYCTQTYGSKNGGGIDAIQIELPKTLRFQKAGRESVIAALSESLTWMLCMFYCDEYRAKI